MQTISYTTETKAESTEFDNSKMDLERWFPLLLDAVECSSPKHSIIGYESCIFGRCFLFFSEASFWQDFLYHQEAMVLNDVAEMLSGSLPQ